MFIRVNSGSVLPCFAGTVALAQLPHRPRFATIRTLMTLWPISHNFASTLVLAAAAGGAAVGSNAAANALETPDVTPGAWSFSFAWMTAVIAFAALHRQPAMAAAAIGVCFSASVAAMTLGLGIVLVVAGRSKAEATPLVSRRAALLFPVSLLAFLVGFNGSISRAHALIIALEAVAILPLCAKPLRIRWSLASIVQLLVSAALIAVSGWTATSAAAGIAQGSEIFRSGVLPALVLGPIVALPMIPAVATLAETGMATAAIDSLVMFALLNLCVVLPTLTAVYPGLPVPLLTWRLDTVLLAIVGMLLLPPSIGRWTLGRREGFALIACFVAYLMITLVVTLG